MSAETVPRAPGVARGLWRAGTAVWPAVAGAGLYAAILIARTQHILTTVYWSPDVPAAALVGQAIVHGSRVTLPTQTAIGQVLFQGLTSGLPGYRPLTMLLGLLMVLITVAVLAATARVVMDGRAAIITAALALSAGPGLLASELYPDGHDTSLVGSALIALLVVSFNSQASRRRRHLVATAIGAVAGLSLVSDPEFLVVGVAPVVVVVGVGWLIRRPLPRRLILVTAAAAAAAVAGIVELLMALLHVHVIVFLIGAHLSLSGIVSGLGASVGFTLASVGGTFIDAPFGPRTVLGAVLLIAIVLITERTVRHEIAACRAQPEAAMTPRLAYALFWAAVQVGLIGAVSVTGLATGRYAGEIFYGAAALVPLLIADWVAPPTGSSRHRRAVVSATGLYCLSAAMAIATWPDAEIRGLGPSPQEAQVADFLVGHHLTHGYSGFWESYGLTWQTEGRVTVWPITRDCGASATTSICPYLFSADTWYTPQPGNSFILLRPDAGCSREPPAAVYGPPSERYDVGGMRILVYPYDIATHFATLSTLTCFP